MICDIHVVQDHTLHCCKLNYFVHLILLAFTACRLAVESSTPSFSFCTLTAWNACQKKETYLKRHANLYDNRLVIKISITVIFYGLYYCYFMVLPVFCFVFQTGSRYDAQVAVFGSEFQKKLSEQKYFIVSGLKASLQVFHFTQSLSNGNTMSGFKFARWWLK